MKSEKIYREILVRRPRVIRSGVVLVSLERLLLLGGEELGLARLVLRRHVRFLRRLRYQVHHHARVDQGAICQSFGDL